QPVYHHFFDGTEPEERQPLSLGQCENCGVVQLMAPAPSEKLIPRFDWISYNEPEAHLDELVKNLSDLPGISKMATIAGLTYKEDSSLRRFQELGYLQTWRVDPAGDLGISDSRAGIETIQGRMIPPLA